MNDTKLCRVCHGTKRAEIVTKTHGLTMWVDCIASQLHGRVTRGG